MNSSLSKYEILPPLFGFVLGILLTEWIGNEWILIALLSPIFGALSLFKPNLGLLIFIPIGILFSARPNFPENHISHFMGKDLDMEGVLFKSPENKEKGSRLFINVQTIFMEGKEEQVSGKVTISTEERIWGLADGDRVRVLNTRLRIPRSFQNPGSFDIKRYYERQGIYATGFVPGKEWIISFGKDEFSNSFLHSVDRLRVKFGNFVRKKSSFPQSEILSAMTIGDQSGIPYEIRNRFSKTGVVHILSISGLHMAAVALIFYVIIKWTLKRSEFLLLRFQVPRLTAALTIIPVFIYMALAGFATPVVRAFIMAAVYLISIVIGRGESKLNTLAASAFIILLWHPWALFELSFQLSFASVLGILLMNRFYPIRLSTLKDKFSSSVKTTLAASLATLPFIITSFGIFSLVSIPANLVLVPLSEFLIVPLGLLSFLTFLISESIAIPFLYANVFLTKLFLWGNDQFLKIPFSSLTVPSLSSISWIFYVIVMVILLLQKTYPKLRFFLPILILGFLLASAYGILSNPNKGFLEVNFLDAGGRSIIFIRLPEEKTILLDGGFSYHNEGGYVEGNVVTQFLLKSGITKINYLILTSLDEDHIEGTKNIVRKFQVEKLWTNGGKLDSELWEIIRDKNISWKNILDEIEPLEIGGVQIEFFKPRGEFIPQDSSRPYPLIGKLSFREASFLFGEDIAEEKVQNELIEIYRGRIESSVLYLPRVFKKQKDVTDFIRTVSPKIIVTDTVSQSLPPNVSSYIYKNRSPGVFQTDVQGTVTVLTDGKQIRVKTFLDANKELVY
jgi:competence protein ComEC